MDQFYIYSHSPVRYISNKNHIFSDDLEELFCGNHPLLAQAILGEGTTMRAACSCGIRHCNLAHPGADTEESDEFLLIE